jgi:hypothetical protein
MGLGLCNAPANFTRLMTYVLDPFIHQFVIVYLDDICIYSKSLEEDLDHIRQVLTILRKNKLFIKWLNVSGLNGKPNTLALLLGIVTSEHPLRKSQQLKIGLYPKRRSRLNLLLLSVRFIGSLFTTLRTV